MSENELVLATVSWIDKWLEAERVKGAAEKTIEAYRRGLHRFLHWLAEQGITQPNAADIAKGVKGAIEWDHAMSQARADLNWKKMIDLAIDPVKARRYRESSQPIDSDVCTMYGDLCAVKRCNEVLKK